MASGLSLPIRCVNGRAAIDVGEDQLKKIIMLTIADCDSDNPYQELGLEPNIVFAVNDTQVRSYARQRIIEAFKRLQSEGRAELLDEAPTFTDADGELVCSIKYVNLETTLAEELILSGGSAFELYRSMTSRSL